MSFSAKPAPLCGRERASRQFADPELVSQLPYTNASRNRHAVKDYPAMGSGGTEKEKANLISQTGLYFEALRRRERAFFARGSLLPKS